jgi:hypothetical protein
MILWSDVRPIIGVGDLDQSAGSPTTWLDEILNTAAGNGIIIELIGKN